MKNQPSQKAFTLLEVMISMVIFAVGLLGLAGIQALSLENTGSSYSRTQAILLASDMIDRMKSNFEATNYTIETDDIDDEAPAKECNDGVVTCTTGQMATFDLWQWKKILDKSLLSGKGKVVYDTTTEIYTISVHWDENRTGATGTGCSSNLNTDLSCIKLTIKLQD